MAFDTSSIDEAIRLQQEEHERKMARLAAIKDIASDPEAVELLQKLIGPNGKGTTVSRIPVVVPPAQIEPIPTTDKQITAIRRLIAAQDGPFTVSSLGDALRASGMEIDNIAVGRALQRLWKKYKEIDLIVEGGGKVPNTYAKTANLKVPR